MLQLYMLGLIVSDMGQALEFYRRLGLAVPADSEGKTHVGIKMDSGLTLFLDSRPSAWDAPTGSPAQPVGAASATGYGTVLEFYLTSRAEVDAKYHEMIGFGYLSHAAPFETRFGMYFALIHDPDGNTVLLSAS
ncbi:MAG: hypothetical protein M3Z04_04965 [Chloroflexota bacterium]|nr:hypothetical protein [Chloroflexota bacterium]